MLYRISPNSADWNDALGKLRKCVLLCKNCAEEVERGKTDIPADIVKFDEAFANYQANFKCPVCGRGYGSKQKVISD